MHSNNKRYCGLDIGDQWTGIALSDTLALFAKPLKTVATAVLEQELAKLLAQENIATIVIGNPITLRGTISEQTKKIHLFKEKLETLFKDTPFVLCDERLSSKRAQEQKPARTKEEKLFSHARAAANILQLYLDFIRNQHS